MVAYCILTGILAYYIALWLWYRHADNRRSEKGTNDKTVPESQADGYTLIGESRYKGGLIGTVQDKSGHLPQAAENDTIFAAQAAMPTSSSERSTMALSCSCTRPIQLV